MKMILDQYWAGRIYGTHTGNVFLSLSGSNEELAGSLHFHETNGPNERHDIIGVFNGTCLELKAEQEVDSEPEKKGKTEELSARLFLQANGDLRGEWKVTNEAAGLLHLHPHGNSDFTKANKENLPEQLYTDRYSFGSLSIDRQQISSLASDLEAEFVTGKAFISVNTSTEYTTRLQTFREKAFLNKKASAVRITIQEPETPSISRSVQISFGPLANNIVVQSADEAWVLGTMERFKRKINSFERKNFAIFRANEFGLAQIIFIFTLAVLPSLERIVDRAVLLFVIVLIIVMTSYLGKKLLAPAVIHLEPRPKSLLSKVGPQIFSSLLAIAASVISGIALIFFTKFVG